MTDHPPRFDHTELLREAVRLAQDSRTRGGRPFGAVPASAERIVASTWGRSSGCIAASAASIVESASGKRPRSSALTARIVSVPSPRR